MENKESSNKEQEDTKKLLDPGPEKEEKKVKEKKNKKIKRHKKKPIIKNKRSNSLVLTEVPFPDSDSDSEHEKENPEQSSKKKKEKKSGPVLLLPLAEIKEKIESSRKKFISIITDSLKPINEKFKKYSDEIEEMYQKISEEIKTLGERQNRPIQKHFNENFENLIMIEEGMQESISDLLEMLENFLSDFEFLHQQNPVQSFLMKNIDVILNSWILKKIKFKSIDTNALLKNDKLTENQRKFIQQEIKAKMARLEFKCKEDCESEMRTYLKENKNTVKKLSFKNIKSSDFYIIFDKETKSREVKLLDGEILSEEEVKNLLKEEEEQKGTEFYEPLNFVTENQFYVTDEEKLNGITKIKAKKCNFMEVRFCERFPNLDKLVLEQTPFDFENVSNRYFPQLTQLYLNKMNLTTRAFNNIMERLINSKDISYNLKVLSFEDNKISQVELSEEAFEKSQEFQNLQEISFEGNKIFKFFTKNLSFFPAIKYLNFISNNWSFIKNFEDLKDAFKGKKVLVAASKNLFVFKKKEQESYIKYLSETLSTYDYPVKKLTFEMLFNSKNQSALESMIISETVQTSLKHLNLSFCSLTNESLIKFLGKCRDMMNLSTLVVCSNNFTDDIFELLSTLNSAIFERLSVIDFSGNEKIEGKGHLIKLENLIKSHKNLKKLIFLRTGLEENFKSYLRLKFKENKTKSQNDEPGILPENGKTPQADTPNEEFNQFFLALTDEDSTVKLCFKDTYGKKGIAQINKYVEFVSAFCIFKANY